MTLESLVPWRRNTSLLSSDPFGSEPMSAMSSLQREMNRMFNNMWSEPTLARRPSPLTQALSTVFYPDVEVSETDGHIQLSAEIPGVSEKDIDLTISADGTSLSIRGEKKLAKEKKEKEYYCAERVYGEFRRTVTLPCAVNQDKVEAKFHNGVLEIDLTKTDASSNVKHIPIKAPQCSLS